jgi:hypothetical protein
MAGGPRGPDRWGWGERRARGDDSGQPPTNGRVLTVSLPIILSNVTPPPLLGLTSAAAGSARRI